MQSVTGVDTEPAKLGPFSPCYIWQCGEILLEWLAVQLISIGFPRSTGYTQSSTAVKMERHCGVIELPSEPCVQGVHLAG